MKRVLFLLVVAAMFACPPAFAKTKACEDLKAAIEAQLAKKGVKEYTLEILPADQVKGQKVVGSCDGGAKKIVYSRKK